MTPGGEKAPKTVAEVGERRLIAMIQRAVKRSRMGDRVGIGDDAAVIPLDRRASTPQVVSTDMLVEGTHWRPAHLTAAQLGRRALVINLSDIAAMGARPTWFTLGVAMPSNQPLNWFRGVLRGIVEAADEFECPLIGGDLVRSPIPSLSITVTGTCVGRNPCRRDAARVGDCVCVTGDLGRARLALAHLSGQMPLQHGVAPLMARHRHPQPRLREAEALVRMGAVHAMMDVSDGLSSDLPWIADLSGVAIEIDLETLPIHGSVRRVCGSQGVAPEECAALSGEEFELLFTTSRRPETIVRELRAQGIETPVTAIGSVRTGRGIRWLKSGKPMRLSQGEAFAHFAQGRTPDRA